MAIREDTRKNRRRVFECGVDDCFDIIGVVTLWACAFSVECGGKCIRAVDCAVWIARDYGDDLCRDFATYVEKRGGVLVVVYDVR